MIVLMHENLEHILSISRTSSFIVETAKFIGYVALNFLFKCSLYKLYNVFPHFKNKEILGKLYVTDFCSSSLHSYFQKSLNQFNYIVTPLKKKIPKLLKWQSFNPCLYFTCILSNRARIIHICTLM